jgi:plastocyanin
MAVALAAYAAPAAGQDAPRSGPHMIVVKLVERGGSVPYAFEPGNIDVVEGDTVRFVQAANAPHNVRFTKTPPGARLGSAATGPYLVKKDQTYDLVIDSRFTNGTYAYVCDPHEMIGMHGSMTVGSAAAAGSK